MTAQPENTAASSPDPTMTAQVTEEMVEAGCRAAVPDIFSIDRRIAHRAASPLDVEVVRNRHRKAMRAALTAALSLPAAAEGWPSKIERLRSALRNTKDALASIGYLSVENLGSFDESGRPPHYFECKLCGDWSECQKDVEHADGCPLSSLPVDKDRP